MRRLIGRVDDVLADMDQRAAHRQIVQDARIVAHIGQRGRGLRQTRQIAVTAHLDQARIGLHRRMQRQRRDDHAAALELGDHDLVDPRMQRIVEMLGLEDRGDPLDRLIVDQHRAEQRLLDVDVIGDVAIDFLFHGALGSGRCGRPSGGGRNQAACGAGRKTERIVVAQLRSAKSVVA